MFSYRRCRPGAEIGAERELDETRFRLFRLLPRETLRIKGMHDVGAYREYNSTMSCSLTIGCISSRDGMCETLPLRASRSAVSQSGTGTICVRSRLRSTNWRDFGLSLIVIASPAFTLYEAMFTVRPFTSTWPCDTS